MTITRMITKLRDNEELIIGDSVRIFWRVTEYNRRLVIEAPLELAITKRHIRADDDGETQQQETDYRQRRDGKRIART